MEKREDYGKSAESWFASLDEPLFSIADKLRRLIKSTDSEITETLKWGVPNYTKGGAICALRAGNGYIALQFYDGTSLDDPDSLLEGSGKKMRHIKVWSKTEIIERLFISWVKQVSNSSKK